MRHDPASGAIVIMLRSLKMHGMAQSVTDLIEQGAPAFDAAVPILAQLLKAELAEREVRSIAYHMKAARFPAYKDLSGFDFAASEINEATVRQLHCGEFMEGARSAAQWLRLYTSTEASNASMRNLLQSCGAREMGFADDLNMSGEREILFRLK